MDRGTPKSRAGRLPDHPGRQPLTRAGVLCALGIMTGNTGWALASWLGLAALPAQAIAAVQILGGVFLVWMGVQAVRPAPAPAGAGGDGDGSAPPAQPRERNPFLVGLVTNLANPKALLFFAAIFAQYGNSFWAVALVCSTGFIYFISFALLVDKISPLLQRLARGSTGVPASCSLSSAS
ncbi:LysE family translocator [Corynebacterium renale]|uniref:LysE family translocator n=1 Tax=Corynebacterium renale TaxID=1724 RepID=UPI00128D85B2|nr:LysE family transporter [Corynebacterium renale]